MLVTINNALDYQINGLLD